MLRKILFGFMLAASLAGCSMHGGFSKSPFASGPVDANVSRPTKIALLLPVDGPMSGYGKAIQNGFFAAYYEEKNSGHSSPTISVINTNSSNIISAYDQAVASGANLIVGPLTKTEVAALAHSNKLTVPTLALNTLDTNSKIPNLFQFGLSPSDEAYQAAEKAAQDHHLSALIIAPDSAWGKSVVNIFVNRYKALGGKVVGQEFYSNQQNLMRNVTDLLQVKEIKKLDNHGKKEKPIPTHRNDADAIFMVATPYYARQIRPMLQYYFAGNIPVYATSQIYSGRINPERDRDLDGILFCDMPWVLPSNTLNSSIANIQRQAQMAFPNSYANNAKLFALGVDAYRVSMALPQMVSNPQSGLLGATGTLFIGQNLHIYRQLMWLKMVNGQPQLSQ